jgi:hypothetical protein
LVTRVGLTLQPDPVFLDLLDETISSDVDYFEVAPETLWFADADGAVRPNGFHDRFGELRERTGKPFVAHGVGLSMASSWDPDRARRRRWLDRVRADGDVFGFEWYSDHYGASVLGGYALTLPVPLPNDDATVAATRTCLSEMQTVVDCVAVENTAFYFCLDHPLREAEALADIASGGFHLVLDLHNLYAMERNFGVPAEAYLERLPLGAVIEIHVAGGTNSDPAWTPSRRALYLDSHDRRVPQRVWKLLRDVAPRCPHLRGVTLERMEGTVTRRDVPMIREDIATARELLQSGSGSPAPPSRHSGSAPIPRLVEDRATLERILAGALLASDPLEALRCRRDAEPLVAALEGQRDELALAAALIARLRFERLVQGHAAAAAAFDANPRELVERFRRYHAEVAPAAMFPLEEAALFDRWIAATGT